MRHRYDEVALHEPEIPTEKKNRWNSINGKCFGPGPHKFSDAGVDGSLSHHTRDLHGIESRHAKTRPDAQPWHLRAHNSSPMKSGSHVFEPAGVAVSLSRVSITVKQFVDDRLELGMIELARRFPATSRGNARKLTCPKSEFPIKVSALVADHVPVELTCRADYPSNETIEVVVKPEGKFPGTDYVGSLRLHEVSRFDVSRQQATTPLGRGFGLSCKARRIGWIGPRWGQGSSCRPCSLTPPAIVFVSLPGNLGQSGHTTVCRGSSRLAGVPYCGARDSTGL
jgi:hypothetical protein